MAVNVDRAVFAVSCVGQHSGMAFKREAQRDRT
jgi:hypothetical protein